MLNENIFIIFMWIFYNDRTKNTVHTHTHTQYASDKLLIPVKNVI